MLLVTDSCVENLFSTLKDNGFQENTLFVFSADSEGLSTLYPDPPTHPSLTLFIFVDLFIFVSQRSCFWMLTSLSLSLSHPSLSLRSPFPALALVRGLVIPRRRRCQHAGWLQHAAPRYGNDDIISPKSAAPCHTPHTPRAMLDPYLVPILIGC